MSIPAYLDKLDLDQLMTARDEAQRRIDAKQQEQRVCVWEVVEDGFVLNSFEDYLAAAQYLYSQAVELSASAHASPKSKRLWLDYRLVPVSEFRKHVPEGHA